jgi:Bacterial archaeo-eukaryotic release factor family 7
MRPISRAELAELVEPSSGYVASIYMPGYAGAESRQNPVRFKNLLTLAEEKLLGKGVRWPDAEALLAPARELLDEPTLWNQIGTGLAVFIDSGGARVWQLPFAAEERCVISNETYVIPLLIWLSSEASYYVLAVSQNDVRVLRGTHSEIEELEVPGLPRNRYDALRLDDPEPTQQAYVSRSQVPGKGDLMFHGHGGAPDAAKVELEAFLRDVDRTLSDVLRQETQPLVFAGVDYLFPIYQQVNTYAHLLPTPIAGNPELLSPADLREKAWPLVEPLLAARREKALEKYGNLIPQGRALNHLEGVLVAAHAGAVETLFIDPRAERWGAFNPDRLQLRFDDSPQVDSEDLINLAAALVLRGSGAVIPLESRDVPGDGEVAAILRYEYKPAGKTAAAPAESRS